MLTISLNELCGETHHTEDKGQPPWAAADVAALNSNTVRSEYCCLTPQTSPFAHCCVLTVIERDLCFLRYCVIDMRGGRGREVVLVITNKEEDIIKTSK